MPKPDILLLGPIPIIARALEEVLALLRPCVASLGDEKAAKAIEIPSESVSLDPVEVQHDLRVSS